MGIEFFLIGYIVFDVYDFVYVEKLGLKIFKLGFYWIKSLYIFYVL